MGYAELIRTLESLPSERRSEVFDFVEFLAARCASSTTTTSDSRLENWNEADFSQLSLAQAMRGLEDEPMLYTRDDLKEAW